MAGTQVMKRGETSASTTSQALGRLDAGSLTGRQKAAILCNPSAAIGEPSGIEPYEKLWIPQTLQNRCRICF